MEEEDFLTPTDVKRFVYCPKIIYISRVLHLEERTTDYMEFGREKHDKSIIAPLIASLKASRVLEDVEMESQRLKMRGKIDYIIVTKFNEYVPAEIKWAEASQSVKRDHALQMATYSLLIEENFNTVVKRGAVYYLRSKNICVLSISEDLKKEAKSIIKKISEIIDNELEPEVKVIKSRCMNCGFKNYCLTF
ncbi:MAG: CRISPR-associated protein Cas4 [Thaumarchaeota archaeon]|nr:CRISPR-associated protein Cas4 [Nitrososphaerota archaeon]